MNTGTRKSKRRAKVEELPAKQELTTDQAKSVKGGIAGSQHPGGANFGFCDGSVRNITDGTSNTLLVAEKRIG